MLGFSIIPQGYARVVERFGRFHRVQYSGIRFMFPLIESIRPLSYKVLEKDVDGNLRVRRVETRLIDLREQVLDFPKQSVITRDNDAVLYYRIEEPQKAVYGVANLLDALEKLVQTTLRGVVGQMSLDETLSSRDTINARLRDALDEATPSWGVKVIRVELPTGRSPPTHGTANDRRTGTPS